MRGCLVGADRQHGVEQQHPLLGPAVEVARRGDGRAGVVGDLLEDVLQRGREGNAVGDRETESVGLPGTVIGVLADDDHFQLFERAFVEGPENVAAAGKDAPRGVLLPHELREGGEIGFLEFGGEDLFPVGCDLYIHDISEYELFSFAQDYRSCRSASLSFSVSSSPSQSNHGKSRRSPSEKRV